MLAKSSIGLDNPLIAQIVARAVLYRSQPVAARLRFGHRENDSMDSMNLRDTAAWRFQVIAAFVIALGLTTGGVLYMPVSAWIKGYLLMGVYFTVSSAFGLAKTLRDAHESSQIIAKISEAKTEKMLRDLAQA